MSDIKGKPAPWPGRADGASEDSQQEQQAKDTTAPDDPAQRKDGLRHISEYLADLLQP